MGAFSLPWENRAEVFVRTAAPVLLFVAFSLGAHLGAWYASELVSWILVGLYFTALCWLAVVVHRMVLLQESVVPMSFDAGFLPRFAKFLVASISVSWISGASRAATGGVLPSWQGCCPRCCSF